MEKEGKEKKKVYAVANWHAWLCMEYVNKLLGSDKGCPLIWRVYYLVRSGYKMEST